MGKVTRPILTEVFPTKRLFSLLDGLGERPVIWGLWICRLRENYPDEQLL